MELQTEWFKIFLQSLTAYLEDYTSINTLWSYHYCVMKLSLPWSVIEMDISQFGSVVKVKAVYWC